MGLNLLLFLIIYIMLNRASKPVHEGKEKKQAPLLLEPLRSGVSVREKVFFNIKCAKVYSKVLTRLFYIDVASDPKKKQVNSLVNR